MSFTAGTGIVTCNRKEIVIGTIGMGRGFARHPAAAPLRADDGSGGGDADGERHICVGQGTMAQHGGRAPWGTDNALPQVHPKTESAMGNGPVRLRLTAAEPCSPSGQPAARGFFARTFPRS
jgi:hypothetical protein